MPIDVEMTRRQVAAVVERRAGRTSSYDAEARTVQIVIATETPVRMPGWRIGIDARYYYEILDCTPGAVDLSEVETGNCPVLDSHGRWSLQDRLGVVNRASVEGREVVLVATFGQSQAARDLEAEVAADTAPPASAGYAVSELILERYEGDVPVYRAIRWKLTEASFTPIAADTNAGTRSDHGQHPCIILETRAMPPENTPAAIPAAPAQTREQLLAGISDPSLRAALDGLIPATVVASPARAAPSITAPEAVRQRGDEVLTTAQAFELQDQARTLGVEDQVRTLLTTAGSTRAQISEAILSAAAARQAGGGNRIPAGSGARVGDEREGVRTNMRDAIRHNLAGTSRVDDVPEGARQYMGRTPSELAMECLGERTPPRSTADRIELLERAFHTTSDFGNIMGAGLNVRMEDTYQAAEPTYRLIAQETTFVDFRAHDVIRPGDFPSLQKINEAGEIKYGTFGDKREQVFVVPYGVQFGLSRQLLINDRWGEIDTVLNNYGIQVALFEEVTFYDMKNQNNGLGPVLLEDNKTVFHADHGNLAAAGAAIAKASLGLGRAAMRKQKNLSGKQMGIPPKILLGTPDNETAAEDAITPVIVNDAVKANPFAGKLELVIGGQLSGNAWELYADRRFGSNWTWGLLDGFKAPRLKIEESFGIQGVKVKLEHDFGCGPRDFRFGYRNPGA